MEIVQGGVHSSVVADLKLKLAACGYTPKDKKFYVVLFHDWHGVWNAKPFGLDLKTEKAKDFEDTNIHPVPLHDPTMLKNWQEAELRTFYAHVEMAKEARARGLQVIAVCMKGENRSKAVQWALDPKDEHLPTCVSMRRAAEGFRDNCDLRIVPLGPPRLSRSKAAKEEAVEGILVNKKPRVA